MKYRIDLPFFLKDGEIINIDEFPTKIAEKSGLVYEVVRIIDSKPLFLDKHLVRLNHSLKCIGKFAISKNLLLNYVADIVEENSVKNGNLKIVIDPKKNYVCKYLYFIPHRYPSDIQIEEGVTVLLQYDTRSNPMAKIANWNIRSRANKLIDTLDVYETLLVNRNNEILEGSRSNIFFIRNHTIYTANDRFVLSGVTRQILIDIINDLKIEIKYQSVIVNELYSYNACFLTGTSIGILQIKCINNHQFEINNPLFVELLSVVNKMIT